MRLRHPVSVLLFAGFAAACGDDAPPPPPLTATVGGFTVTVESAPPRIEVTAPDGTLVWDGRPEGIALRHADASWEFVAGHFKIEEDEQVEPWRPAVRLADTRLEDGQVRFRLLDRAGAELGEGIIAGGAAGSLSVTIHAATGSDVNRISLSAGCDAGEHFLGFGGQSFDVDHRGQTVPIWVEEDGIQKAPVDDYGYGIWQIMGRRHSTHTPMPIYLSSRGYAALLMTPRRSIFAMCSEDPEVVRVEAWDTVLQLVLFAGPSPKEAIERLTAYLGRPELPPAFTFAPWLDALFGSENVRRVATKLRAEGVPSSVIWTEDWRGGNTEGEEYVLEEDWELDRALYPDFEEVAADLHAQGFKWLVYENSFLDTTAPIYAEAAAAGYTIHDATGGPYLFTGVKFRDSSLLDLSNPDAVAWAKDKYREALTAGADGWMADFAEWLPHDAVLASGADAMAAHNLYPVDWVKLNQELLDEQEALDGVERLFFCRAAYVGSQPLVSVVWAGDQQTDWTEGDGLPSVIPMGIGLGVTGFPYFGHDIGGYLSRFTVPTSRELWFRWVTFGALSPVMRTHHGRSIAENWSWEKDAESIAHFRRWAELHIRLYPYLAALAREAAERGTPMMRAFALEYPAWETGWTLLDEYLLGDRIAVAPVQVEGAASRTVALPEGTWYPLEGGAAVTMGAGGGTVQATAAVEEIPAFVPAGTLLPLLPEGVDTLTDADPASGAVTLADVADDRELWLWPGGASALDEGGGLTYAWDAAALAGPVTEATWNGAPVTVGATIDVTGPGTLVVNGGQATLAVAGGAAERQLTIRLR